MNGGDSHFRLSSVLAANENAGSKPSQVQWWCFEYRLVGQGTHISSGDAEQPRTRTTVTRVPGAPFPLSQSSHPLRLSRQRFGGHSEANLSVADL